MQPILRDYQQKIINSLRKSIAAGNKWICLCLATGGGKTIVFSYMVSEHLKKGGRALILTDRIELLKQAAGAFSKFGIHSEYIKAGHEPDLTKNLHIASIETLYRRAEKYRNYIANRTLIVIDEMHKTAFEKLFPYIHPDTLVIGATATPHRSGKQPSLDRFFTDIVQEVDTPDLIQKGFLSDANTYGVDIDLQGVKKKGGDYDTEEMGRIYGERKIYEGVIENYNKLVPGTKALLFAPNIASSKEMCDKLIGAGLPAIHLDGEMGQSERNAVLSRFSQLKHIILCNCSVLTTGFDQPDIETIILYRATTSLPLFLQMVGRGSRVTDNKRTFNILDFGNNIKTHGFWEQPRSWSLSKVEKKKKVPPIKSCPKCNAMLPASARQCKYCGWAMPLTEKEVKEKEFAELKLLPKNELWGIASNADIKRKAEMAKAKLISPMRVLHSLTSEEEADAFIKEMNYKPGFKFHNRDRFAVWKEKEIPEELINKFGHI